MKKVFVVMHGNFEYTDEYYYTDGGGDPVRAFPDRASADEACGELNHKFVTTTNAHTLAEYFQGAEDGSWDDCVAAAEGGPETRLAFAEKVGLRVYYVAEVTMEEPVTLEDSKDFEFNE